MGRQNRHGIWPSGRPNKLARRPFFGGAVGPFWQRTLWREGRKEGGIDVKTQKDLLYRYAVIDRSVVWYGNIEYLSYSMKDANALRFESPNTAGELLDLWKKEDEQLHLEMSV